MESRKTVLRNLFAGQQWRHRHREQTYGHGGGVKGREGRMESSMETYKLSYVKQIAGGKLLYYSGNSNQGLCNILKEWDGVGGGMEDQGGTYVYP